jgi:ankyrin repeat protein
VEAEEFFVNNKKMSALSEFYLACRNGDLIAVQHLLPNISDEQKNRLESNGSTALHAATYFGHHTIVKCLLENGCVTWIRNNYNNTPYDEAQDDEMRQLFVRPDRNSGSNRFASTDDCFGVVTRNVDRNNDETEDDDNIPKGWVDGYNHTGTLQKREETVQQIVHAQMMKYCLKKFQVSYKYRLQ